MKGIWKNITFRKLFAAYSLSTFGDWFDILAISVLIGYIWHADPLVISLVPIAYALPGILFGQIAGILADRLKKLRILIAADLVSALLTVGVALAPNIYWLLGLLTLRSLAGVFHYPAQQSLTRQVVAPDQLLQASSANGAVNQFGKILGPLLGAAVLGAVSPQVCLLVNAATFVLSAVILATVDSGAEAVAEAAAAKEEQPRFAEAWKEGWQAVLGNRALLATILFAYTGYFILQFVDFQYPVVYREVFPETPELLAWGMALIGVGSVAAILVVNRIGDIRNYGLFLGLDYVIGSTLTLFMGLLKPGMSMAPVLLFCLIGGVSGGMKVVGASYIIQKETPPHVIGRVSGITNTLGSLIVVVSPVAGGALIQAFGASPVFLGIGGAMLLLGLTGIVGQRVLFGQRR